MVIISVTITVSVEFRTVALAIPVVPLAIVSVPSSSSGFGFDFGIVSFGISIGFRFGYRGSFGFRCRRPLVSVVTVSVRVAVVSTIVSAPSAAISVVSMPSISGSISIRAGSCFGLGLKLDISSCTSIVVLISKGK